MTTDQLTKLYTHFKQANGLITTDTRKIEKGSIFFALKGDNFDANNFAVQAIEAGCSLAVVDNPSLQSNTHCFVVDNVLKALQDLANFHRKAWGKPIIGVTGSNGKTTTKELLHAVLNQKTKVLATEGNLNNHIGVPLTLLKLRAEHEMAIVEMGANHQGEIAELCLIAEPNFGLITNIGKAHLEGFGGIEGVKKGKGELYQYLKQTGGKVFLHGDDPVLSDMAQDIPRVTYGTKKLYDVVGKWKNGETVSFAWTTRYGASTLGSLPFLPTHLVGEYNYHNVLAAACVGHFFGLESDKINHALSGYIPTNSRSQLTKTANNELILDCYNANPTSMQAAIRNFSTFQHKEKALILGDMLELGSEAQQEHEAIVHLVRSLNLSPCFFVGPEFMKQMAPNSFLNIEELAVYLEKNPIRQKTILIKGSRGIKLEKVLSKL